MSFRLPAVAHSADDVDDAHKLILLPPWYLADERPAFEPSADLQDRLFERGALAVKLVAVGDARDLELMSRRPDALSVRLDTLDGVDDTDCTVEDWETPVDFEPEVLMARGVDQVDCLGMRSRGTVLCPWPVKGDGCRLNGDAALPLKFEKIGYSVAGINI